MGRRVGDRERFPCVSNEIGADPDHYCPGSMVGTCGGQYNQDCCCGGPRTATVTQFINCHCDECGARCREVFEYFCSSCGNYELSHRLSVEDLESDCSYSWPGIGFPLAEVDNMGALVRGAIALCAKTVWRGLELVGGLGVRTDEPVKNSHSQGSGRGQERSLLLWFW
jgi:hypothetical protein